MIEGIHLPFKYSKRERECVLEKLLQTKIVSFVTLVPWRRVHFSS